MRVSLIIVMAFSGEIPRKTSHGGIIISRVPKKRPSQQRFLKHKRMAAYLHILSGILLPGRFVSSPSHATCSVFPGTVHRSLSESSTPPVLVRIFPGEASPESLKNRLILASEPAELWLKVRKANIPPRGPAWGRSCE